MSIAYEQILVLLEGPLATVTLNRPERMNATTWRMMAELRHAIAAADADEGIRAIIVTGAGRAFCAGADLSGPAFARNEEQAEERLRVTDELVPPGTKMFWEMNTPIIAAIHGTAVGVGITLPLYFDIRIVAEDAKLGFLFSRRGIIPEWNSPWLLPRLTGLSRAMELLTTGRFFTGADAVEWGIATEALPADQVVARAREIATGIAENTSAISVGIAKRLIYEGLGSGDAEAFRQRTSEIFRWSTKQADGREGPKAFMEKRKPRFPMKKNADFPEEFFGRP